MSSVPADEHRSVPASAHANAGARDHHDLRSADLPQYGVGPFSVREVSLLGIWVVAFLVSFFRTNILDSPSGVLVGGANVWLSGLWWISTIALPTVAVGLLVLRRLSPQGIRRVGSLGIDQFASVAFTVSALVWISWVWDTVVVFDETGIWTRSWVIWVEAVLMLAGVVLTVFGPLIPPFAQDFRGRDEVPAHRNARPIRPVVARPRTPRTPRDGAEKHGVVRTGEGHAVAADSDALTPGSYTGSTDLSREESAPRTSVLPAHTDDENDTDVFAPLRAEQRDDDLRRDEFRLDEQHVDEDGGDDRGDGNRGGEHAAQDRRDDRDHAHAQAFWALAPEEREIVDDYGTPIFRIGPTAWALVVEDRGETFVVRHDDGRIGYLHDVSGVTRG
ncbi:MULTISPECIES: hypothetical protein [Microbacterium]|uniref:hypothetical protein n=1 Tax=Microbacterium TaxID=33882 RepID=UPI0027D7FC28|nr:MULTISPECIES: hypothetical protein [Microbacterium]